MVLGRVINLLKTTDGPRASPLGDHMTRKDDKGDQPSGGETTWTNTGVTRYGRGQPKTGSFGDDMLRPSPNHGTQWMPNDDDDDDGVATLRYRYHLIQI